MDTSLKLHGLVAAVHTPFKADGSLNPSSVDAQAKLLASQGIKLAFITGSTGESSSMQLEERKEIYSAWKEASAKHGVEVIAHTGSNSVWDARELAAFAQECGFVATSSLAPSYYKPGTVQRLVECCAFAASGAPDLPYYYYDIPVLTGVRFNPVDFIKLAKEQIPNFAGIKFTNPDLALYQTTLNYDETVDIPWGVDEWFTGSFRRGQGRRGELLQLCSGPVPETHESLCGRRRGNGARLPVEVRADDQYPGLQRVYGLRQGSDGLAGR